MSFFHRSRTMGQSNNKMVTTTEARFDKAVNSLELLNKSGKQAVNGMMDIFRHMDNHINTLKSEKEFLTRQLQRIDTKTYSHQGSKDRMIVFCEADTQTETDKDLSLSILNESLSSRNRELEDEITTLRERVKNEVTQTGGNILTNVACKVLLPQTKSDKYVPSGTDEQNSQVSQSEYEQLLNDNDIRTEEIRKLGSQLNLEKQEHILTKEHTKKRIEDLENKTKTLQGQLRKSETDTNKMAHDIEEFHEKSKKDEETINMFKNEMSEKINKIQEQETRIQELSNEIEQNKKLINDKITETSSKDQKKKELNLLIIALKGKLDVNEKQLQEMKQVNAKLDDCNNELRNKNSSAEKTVFALEKRMTERDATVKDLEKKFSLLDEQYKIRGQTIEQKKADLEELRNQIQNKESELTLNKQQMDKESKQLKNELSLEAVNFRNEKVKTKDLENKVSQLKEQISDLKLTNNKLETDLEINETIATQENVKLQELSNDYGSLLEKYEFLKKDKETLALKSKVKKPASDVALVVLHSKEIKKPSEKILTEPDFKKLGIIVDISFLSAKGIISNDTTDNAIKHLSAFINKFTSD
ncbi:putative leucine-rich repeat-containing protein DDB_G0290503 isoform X2 [Mytilus californianus]|uniref:putative leucine-rich repeat-containing protein DDB_G0290503 isoform X2 n=1 Tax=Mytilus californianus TaxID=6549 RepID=UPI0022485790|nr:putative leucine-rich repeat-containing protein DDB_G0290503 isoform X2 [Mytilus californianus]